MWPRLKLFFMFAVMMALFLFIGYALVLYLGYNTWGWYFLIIMSGVLVLFNIFVYFYSDKMVLKAYRARIVTAKEAPRLYTAVQKVAMKAGMPMPKVAIIPTQTPNAFATGRNPENAVVAATEGIMHILDDEELEGVMAHEMAHVKDRDILVMTVATTVGAIIGFAARIIFFQMLFGRRSGGGNIWLIIIALITAPIAALLVRLAISRSREYKADKVGGQIAQNPKALARALKKLETGNRKRPMNVGNPANSSMFIVNPFTKSGFASLFSTHPPMEERIKRLNEQARNMGYL